MHARRKAFSAALGVAVVLCGTTGCASSPDPQPPSTAQQMFPDETTENYSMGFTGGFPTGAPEASAIASDASGKGPFTATVGCDGGGSMTLRVDDQKPRDIECTAQPQRIEGIQKIARTGGVKFWIASDKDDGHWKIQLVGARP